MTSSSVLSPVRDDEAMTSAAAEPEGPRSERPLRRSFSPAQKISHLRAYEAACEQQQGGAYLRREGLFSSQMSEWRKLRDAGLLTGEKKPGERVGRPSAEQAEIARLRRDLDRAEQRLATTESALTIMGKAHALLEEISKSADIDDRRGKR
jgi:transposase